MQVNFVLIFFAVNEDKDLSQTLVIHGLLSNASRFRTKNWQIYCNALINHFLQKELVSKI